MERRANNSPRHCEERSRRSNPAFLPRRRKLACFASLAMTVGRDAPTSRPPADNASRSRKPFEGPDPLFQPPAIFGRPVLEPRIDAEVVRPMQRDVRIELRLAADRDEIGLSVLQDGFGLLRFENDADGHGRNIRLVANAL